jgi:hypothetical protein
MSVYRVDKTEQPVVVFQSDGAVMKGVVFLSASAYSPVGRQTLNDLLYGKEEFFPFRSEAGAFSVINRATITHLRYEPAASEEELPPPGSPVEVLITFIGGEQLRGTILIEMRAGRNRLTDFINTTENFFTIRSGDANYLVNIAQIRSISAC